MAFAELSPETAKFYRGAMDTLCHAEVPFLVGGAHALANYTGIGRNTKDLDLFVKASDLDRALDVLSADGLRTERTHPHWLGKVLRNEDSIDLIFASGNGVFRVDETWFNHATRSELLGREVLLCPPEEMLAMKSFVMERERYDGADVAHILRRCGGNIDWEHVINLFGPHWRVLLSHLTLYGYIYPSHRIAVPKWVMDMLLERIEQEESGQAPSEQVCRGTLLSRAQYLPDVEEHGYVDARAWPEGSLTKNEIDRWTRSIDEDGDGSITSE